jgi:hypothetical protein
MARAGACGAIGAQVEVFFTAVEKLMEDFRADVRRLRGEE